MRAIRGVAAVSLALFVLASRVALAADEPPVATLTIVAQSVGLGLGFVWGSGTLEFEGRRYAVRVDGMGIGAVGAASVRARGFVHGLKRVEDLDGQYTAIGGGAEVGQGANRLRMRNAAGVVVEIEAVGEGIHIGLGPRGVTLEVAAGAPLSPKRALPQSLGFGEAAFGPLSLQPTLNAQLAGFAEANAGFGGTWGAGPIDESGESFEHSNEVGLNASLALGDYGKLHGRVSGVFSLAGGGIDPGATSSPDVNTRSYTIEDAFLGWRSGDLFPALGADAVEVAYGNQNYQVFDGLVFWTGATNCGPRGACWIAPRNAFREAGTVRLSLRGALIEGFHLRVNDDPSTRTRLGGGRVEYAVEDRIVKSMRTGFLYFDVYQSDEPSRDGLNGFYLYQETTPAAALPDFMYTTSFVAQTNSRAHGNAEAYGWYVAPAYTLSHLAGSPQLTYRYASFSGGGSRNYDPLFGGLSEWGTWAQGELLGEWVLANTNLRSHMVRLKASPNDVVTLHLIYYKFLLDDREQSFGAEPTRVASRSLADEIDGIVDIAAANWWSITLALAVAVPNDGFREATGGSRTWVHGMIATNWNF